MTTEKEEAKETSRFMMDGHSTMTEYNAEAKITVRLESNRFRTKEEAEGALSTILDLCFGGYGLTGSVDQLRSFEAHTVIIINSDEINGYLECPCCRTDDLFNFLALEGNSQRRIRSIDTHHKVICASEEKADIDLKDRHGLGSTILCDFCHETLDVPDGYEIEFE